MVVEVCVQFKFNFLSSSKPIFPVPSKVSIYSSFTLLSLRSFVVSGGSAVYVAAYSVFYFVTKLEIDEFVPTLLYFSYTVRFYSRDSFNFCR